ncbi:MAG TPA: hypothetical protein VN960_05615 [Gaiellaceae bacterium]|nr:hypothetical protein [Gaiellaceae bacterium]
MLPSGPGGVNNPPAVTALTCYSTLLQERRAESNTVDTSRLISWKKVVQVEDQHVLIHGGEIRVVPASEQRFGDGKMRGKPAEIGGAFLDAILLDQTHFDSARQSEIEEAARLFAEQEQLRGNDLRRLNQLIAAIVLVKNGVTQNINPWELP